MPGVAGPTAVAGLASEAFGDVLARPLGDDGFVDVAPVAIF